MIDRRTEEIKINGKELADIYMEAYAEAKAKSKSDEEAQTIGAICVSSFCAIRYRMSSDLTSAENSLDDFPLLRSIFEGMAKWEDKNN